MSKTFATVMSGTVERLKLGDDCRLWRDHAKVINEMAKDLAKHDIKMKPFVDRDGKPVNATFTFDEGLGKTIGQDFTFTHNMGSVVAPLADRTDVIWLKSCHIETLIT